MSEPAFYWGWAYAASGCLAIVILQIASGLDNYDWGPGNTFVVWLLGIFFGPLTLLVALICLAGTAAITGHALTEAIGARNQKECKLQQLEDDLARAKGVALPDRSTTTHLVNGHQIVAP